MRDRFFIATREEDLLELRQDVKETVLSFVFHDDQVHGTSNLERLSNLQHAPYLELRDPRTVAKDVLLSELALLIQLLEERRGRWQEDKDWGGGSEYSAAELLEVLQSVAGRIRSLPGPFYLFVEMVPSSRWDLL